MSTDEAPCTHNQPLQAVESRWSRVPPTAEVAICRCCAGPCKAELHRGIGLNTLCRKCGGL